MKINKFIAAVMALTIVGGSVPFISDIAPDTVITASAADYKELKSGDFTFYVYSDHAELKKYEAKSVKDITIPSEADGQPVTIICNGAFRDNSSITAVIIPDSVVTIEPFAFYYCSSITDVTVGNGVKTVSNYAFCDCNNLVELTLGNSVVEIGEAAFEGCKSLTEITLPATVSLLKENAFSNCSALVACTLSDEITVLPVNAFSGCKSLRGITLPKKPRVYRR